MYDDSKATYAIIAILIVVLGGIAYYLRSNSVEDVAKNKISVITETKVVDTKKFNNSSTTVDGKVLGASTTIPTATTTSASTSTNVTNATTSMTDNINAPKVIHGAILHTNMGDIEVAFTKDTAKDTVINFVSLSANKFYEGIRFHRVIQGFMIQAGDPLSKDLSKKDAWGTGGPGYAFKDELSGKETYPQGTLAMANAGPNTNGSQFFIVTADPAPLPPSYTVFGNVVKGMDVAMKIENVKTGARDVPVEDVIINSVELK